MKYVKMLSYLEWRPFWKKVSVNMAIMKEDEIM